MKPEDALAHVLKETRAAFSGAPLFGTVSIELQFHAGALVRVTRTRAESLKIDKEWRPEGQNEGGGDGS